MDLIDAINPKTFYETCSKIVRNYLNWRFYKKTMKRLQANGSLKQNGMRLDMRNRAYYVLNLEPETLMLGQEVLELEKSRVFESLAKKKVLFEDANLSEIIEARTERIKTDDYYAYLLQIKYMAMSSFGDIVYALIWLAAAATTGYFLTMGIMEYKAIFQWVSSIMTAR
jgi:hypothetical protein